MEERIMNELPKTMRALVAYGKHDYRYEAEYPVPVCGPD
jgi:L-iditol 2-dehydrogenase